ncbi:hypothetical protein Sta7437_0695 [Stanieria cyanosphaera PCC 7437]|uniref:Uncharacterized protein n=1 Tax=Stanieria cyanosphaera (strain ATCC 29371 / PCC 7437) TaxID=111780 RepID=K9XNV3_STAC7|nr:hypothetical protein [Stanieria cyanosphaera]AFZ34290.1 hypothetical protein Sta7437_0695 [Stanieria cyanosphaera PCC 7437]
MLSALQKTVQNNSVSESSKNTVIQSNSSDHSWKESSDDVVTVGLKRWMSHQERYEFVKNRTYHKDKPST